MWLLDQGADVNAPAIVDEEGFGGWTPLYHAMISLRVPRSQADVIGLLLERGADADVTASVRKPLAATDRPRQYVEYRQVTPLTYAQQFVYPDLVNEAAVQAVTKALSSK